jgi:GTP pyrophosphokinase
MFEGIIKVFVHDKEELDELANRLKQLSGIHEVQRLDSDRP